MSRMTTEVEAATAQKVRNSMHWWNRVQMLTVNMGGNFDVTVKRRMKCFKSLYKISLIILFTVALEVGLDGDIYGL